MRRRGLRWVAASVAAALSAAADAQGVPDLGQVERIRTELRAWYAAERGGMSAAGDGIAELHRLRVLRAWPRGDLGTAWLRDVEQLRRVFADCFVYPGVDARAFAELVGVDVRVPPDYAPGVSMPATIEVWPGLRASDRRAAAGTDRGIVIRTTPAWLHMLMRPRRQVTWTDVAIDTAMWLLATTPAATAAGRMWSLSQGPIDDERVQRGLFFVLGVVQRRLNLDRDRLYIRGHGSACSTVLRAATSAPDRFAAIVLEEPSEVPALALDNLAGVPVLAVTAQPGGDASAGLRRAFAQVDGARLELRDAQRAADAQVGTWLARRVRRLMRERVTLVMRADGIVDGYWVSGINADLGSAEAEGPARIDVVADRATGVIRVTAWRIDRFTLLLNDELIDLDRAFVLEVNDVRVSLRRTRSLSFLTQTVTDRFDPRFLFTTALAVDVPRRG